MKKVKINFLHPWIYEEKNEDKKIEITKKLLGFASENLNISFEWDDDEPQYVVVSECIYYGEYQKYTKKLYNKFFRNINTVFIFFSGECIEPDLNVFDYALVFDRNHSYNDRIIRIPTKLRFASSIFNETNDIVNTKMAKEELKKRQFFCNFVYSNSKAHANRDRLFHEINRYKPVHSLGKHLNNYEITDEEINSIKDWRLQSIKIKSNYKFTIASENAIYEGYTSEKILTSFQAHSIPIYWGDPTVAEEFNEKAFINANKYATFDALIKKIKEIDENDELWCKMISEPWQTKEQREKTEKDCVDYYRKLKTIFLAENIESKKRVGQGFHPDNYKNYFCDIFKKESISKKLKITIKKIIHKLKK